MPKGVGLVHQPLAGEIVRVLPNRRAAGQTPAVAVGRDPTFAQGGQQQHEGRSQHVECKLATLHSVRLTYAGVYAQICARLPF